MDDNKAAYRRIIESIGAGDEEAVRRLLADDLVDHNPIPEQSPGGDGFLEWMRSARSSFPDLHGSIEDILADGDRIVGRVVWSGTHRGPFLGLEPTGTRVAFEVIHIVRFESGRAAEWWGVADLFGAAQQVRQAQNR